ncbi:hypothetical protein G443_000752 [Actinoalloteichus cyanogriseus DSM 43889]|uniref:Uncharacterized protein n=1 Tax=Actinoalloteichus caeruleus DSM 43889 TaxID=1120930 RepID=A0ABT1JDB0_ACTCY|nr:hypothetical protein [Actinoalloteichus caeruleus DSM 43889]
MIHWPLPARPPTVVRPLGDDWTKAPVVGIARPAHHPVTRCARVVTGNGPRLVRRRRPGCGRRRPHHFRQYAWQVALVYSVSRALDTAPGPTQSESSLPFIDTEDPWAAV